MKTVNIVLVDDDVMDVKAVLRGFKRQRIANPITVAKDGQEALHRLRGENGFEAIPAPWVVLLDLNMPRMNGFEFLDELRADPELRGTVVFVLTTSSHDQDRAEAYDRNVAGYILKNEVGDEFDNLAHLLEAYWRVVELP